MIAPRWIRTPAPARKGGGHPGGSEGGYPPFFATHSSKPNTTMGISAMLT